MAIKNAKKITAVMLWNFSYKPRYNKQGKALCIVTGNMNDSILRFILFERM